MFVIPFLKCVISRSIRSEIQPPFLSAHYCTPCIPDNTLSRSHSALLFYRATVLFQPPVQTALPVIVEKISHQGCRLICPARNCSPYFFPQNTDSMLPQTFLLFSHGQHIPPDYTALLLLPAPAILKYIFLCTPFFFAKFIQISFTRFATHLLKALFTFPCPLIIHTKNRNNKHHYQNRNLHCKRIERTTISVTFHYHHVIHKIREIP